jgi:hypothetical protein
LLSALGKLIAIWPSVIEDNAATHTEEASRWRGQKNLVE